MPTNFVMGLIFVWLGRYELQTSNFLSFPAKAGLLYSFLIFCPVTLWSFYQYPAWATVYLRPEFLIPSWSGPLIVFHYFLGMVFGVLLGQQLLRARQSRYFYLILFFGFFWLMSMGLLTWDEYQHIGTYNAYHAGQAQLIHENTEFMRDMNIMGLVIALPAVLLAVVLVKRGRARAST